ncbi:MAG TPA: hypothetical protein P5162_03395 [Bacteroidia bacterium]|nr:hypothetical protein [Bacteroidia bacterium]
MTFPKLSFNITPYTNVFHYQPAAFIKTKEQHRFPNSEGVAL